MKKLMTTIMTILMLVLILNAENHSPRTEVLDKIVARIGNDIILLSDIQKQMMQMRSTGTLTPDMNAYIILEQMIEQRLIIQKAKEINITVDQARIKTAAERYIHQIRAQFGSNEEFNRELAKMRLTHSDLLSYYTEILTEQALSEQLFTKHIASKVFVSETEMSEFYAAHKDTLAIKPVSWEIGMIMREIGIGDSSESDQYKTIRQALTRLNNGEDFATMAVEVSDCPSSRQGGDLGFFRKGQMVKPFEDAAFKLNVGEISNIVRTEYGFHIIKLEEKRGDEIRARHILKIVQATQADSAREFEQMERIRHDFLKGVPFSDLAKQWSQDDETAGKGGIIGEYAADEFPEIFASILQATPVGGITQVLTADAVLYLFTKIREIPERIYTYEELRDYLRNFLTRQKQMQAYDEMIEQLKRDYHVQIML